MPENENTTMSVEEAIEKIHSKYTPVGYYNVLFDFIPMMYNEKHCREHLDGDTEETDKMFALLDESPVSIDEDAYEFVKVIVKKLPIEDYPKLIKKLMDSDDRYFSFKNLDVDASKEISTLVYHLLDIKDGDRVYNLGCGDGVFLLNAHELDTDSDISVRYKGVDNSEDYANLCSLMLLLAGARDNVEVCRESEYELMYHPFEYNKAYFCPSNEEHKFPRDFVYHSVLYPDITLSGKSYREWVYIDYILSGLEGESPRACAFVSGKSLLNANNNIYLQRLLRDGWIEGIIEFPSCVNCVGKKAFLLVFSRGNKDVRFLDYTRDSLILHKRFSNRIDRQLVDVDYLFHSYEDYGDNRYSIRVEVFPYEQLKDLYSLQPSSFDHHIGDDSRGDYVQIKTIGTVSQGLPDSGHVLARTKELTPFRVLTAADISEDGINWNNLRYVNPKEKIDDKYTVHNGDVVIAPKNTKGKVAIVEKEAEGTLILAKDLLNVRTNQSEYNPYYLKMFLDTQEGDRSLESISLGKTIRADMFSLLKVPRASIGEQNIKVRNYKWQLDMLRSAKIEVQRIGDETSNLVVSVQSYNDFLDFGDYAMDMDWTF